MPEFKFLAFSDRHLPLGCSKYWKWLTTRIREENPDVIVMCGDWLEGKAGAKHAKDERHKWSPVQEFKAFAEDVAGINELAPNALKVWTIGNHDCFDSETEVLTDEGWLYFAQLTGEEKLASVDATTGATRFEKPLGLVSNDWDGDLIVFNGKGINFAVTPNHRMLVSYRGGGLEFRSAKDVFRVDVKRGAQVELPVAAHIHPDCEFLDDDIVRLCAWTLTDGCISSRLCIYQEPDGAKEIVEIIERCGLDYSYRERQRDIRQICGRTLVKESKPAGEILIKASSRHEVLQHLPDGKVIPKWVYTLNQRQFDIFLETVVKADGTPNKLGDGFVVYKSKRFIDDLQRACILHGYRATVSEYRPNNWKLKVCKRPLSTVCAPATTHERRHYKGKVYCATTVDGTLIVRRGGKPLVCGNCNMLNHSPQHSTSEQAETNRALYDALVAPLMKDWVIKDAYTHETRWYLGQVCFRHGADTSAASLMRDCFEYCPYHGLHISGHTHKPMEVTQLRSGAALAPFYHANPGCGADWTRMHYMDRLQKGTWGKGLVVGEVCAPGLRDGRKDYSSPKWKARTEIFEMASNNYADVRLGK